MKRFAFVCTWVYFVLLASSVVAQTSKEMQGAWLCQTGCGCQPTSPDKYTHIKPENGNLSLKNECGDTSDAILQPNSRLFAKDWNVSGTISSDHKSIVWDNKSVWIRVPKLSDLEQRLAYWEGKVFYCNYDPQHPGTKFPSKETSDPKDCDDGDPILENAMLCLAGDARGCDAVRRSQDTHGRWWRSPRKAKTQPSEPALTDNDGQTTFSNDHAIGVWAYITTTNDVNAFKEWIDWIDKKNARCTVFCVLLPPGTPRYCASDKCTFAYIDCPALQLIGGMYNQPVTICALGDLPVPPIRSLAEDLRNGFNDATKRLPPIPEIVVARTALDAGLKVYDETFAKLDQARSLLEERLLRKARTAAVIAQINARVNQGYSIYNSMITILLLEKWGIGSKELTEIARKIADKYPDNPIFEYVAYRKTRGDRMLQLMFRKNQCPSEASDADHRRVEWSWEREPKDEAWKKTMYWDCIFAAELWKNAPIQTPDEDKENAIDEAVKQSYETLKSGLDLAEKHVRQIIDSLPKGIPSTIDLGSPPGPKPPIDCHLIPFGTPGSCQGPKIVIKLPTPPPLPKLSLPKF